MVGLVILMGIFVLIFGMWIVKSVIHNYRIYRHWSASRDAEPLVQQVSIGGKTFTR